MAVIKKIKLCNFKKFHSFSAEFDEGLNLLIGDNESGKSSILSAIDIVLSASRTKVEAIGLDSLFNSKTIEDFLASDKKYENLPKMFVEIYLDEQDNLDLSGKVYSDAITACDGLRLICEPDESLSKAIKEILNQKESNFPFEFYSISFKTFSGEGYAGYKKYVRHVLIDNSHINNEYATREYVKTMYDANVQDGEKNKHQYEYRNSKDHFRQTVLADVNNRLSTYSFSIKTGSKANLETDLTISEDSINIENKGKGRQCFIKTEFALKKKVKNKDLDIVLIEEPENHLSHVNMKKLIRKISESTGRQLFIATHSDLISTRLDLRKSILLNSNSSTPVSLKNIPDETARFFMKAPDNNVLQFILSKKVILVEGDAEYVLMGRFFEKPDEFDVHVISVGGTSFKRYLDIAKVLGIKTAVIRDNDKDYQFNCVDNYSDYTCDFIQIFSDTDNNRYTFEIALYQDNTELCSELFQPGRKTLTVQDYMLKNKADVAFSLLEASGEVNLPSYILEAIQWIKK